MTKTRYSDSELEEFKELIMKKLKEAQEDLDLLKGSLRFQNFPLQIMKCVPHCRLLSFVCHY